MYKIIVLAALTKLSKYGKTILTQSRLCEVGDCIMVTQNIYINESRTDLISLSELAASATTYANASRALNTIRAYRSSWLAFSRWCQEHGVKSQPAEPKTVALYLSSMARDGMKVSTIRLSLTAISEAHRSADLPFNYKDRILSAVWKGIRREVGVRPERKSPLLAADLAQNIVELLTEGAW